ncbi:MAG TPA: C40 family peptidase [Clostridiaceae bacterium]|nr:C40 family peptidase [Clostridiaceae bacterium]
MANDNSKDIANSLNKYTDYTHKGTNLLLDSAENINKWYAEQLNKITESNVDTSRIETGVVYNVGQGNNDKKQREISTKLKQYNEIQTNQDNKENLMKNIKIQTIKENDDKNILENKLNTSKGFKTSVKGVKLINNTSQKIIRTGRDISTGLSESGTTTFKTTLNRIMTKPIKRVASNGSKKVTKGTIKYTKKITKKIGKGIKNKFGKKVISQGANVMVKLMKFIAKMMADSAKMISAMLPQIAPIIIIIVIVAAIGKFLNFKNTKEATNINFDEISELMIVIDDEKIQAIYNEFLKNIGTPYLMDHSNLNYTECMDYYDCSSWVIHCLAHTGIITIPNTGAQGIYNGYCYPVDVSDRKAGDLIFLKDTYDTGEPGSISHIGIYMGTLTINEETAEWVIDTGSNPSGVRIRKYTDGWWNGQNFYGFARLKE